MTPFFFFFFYLPIELQEVTKGFQPFRNSPGNAYCKQSSCCHVYRGTEVIQPNSYQNQFGDVRLCGYLNCRGGGECHLFYMGAVCCWAPPPHSIVGEVVPSFHPSTSCTHTSECFSNFDEFQCAELSLPAGYFAGGDLLHLHFEAWDWGSPVVIFNRAP